MKKILALLFSCVAWCCLGQTITTDTIQWDITEFYNVNAGVHESPGDKLIVYASDYVEWMDANGGARFKFSISEAQGVWNDLHEQGMIEFRFEVEGQPAQLIISRAENGFRFEINLYIDEPNPQRFVLKANAYSVL